MGAKLRAWKLPVLLAFGFVLAGCASSGPHVAGNQHHRFVSGRPNYTVAPYQVNGVWYYPRVDYAYDETGTASWYGPGFDQQATSDGEIYDMNKLSAAHKTLPLPSVVEVTNLQNGRSIRLRVNDRGPFVDGRIIDLSRRAAQLLGFESVGTARVRVRILKEDSVQVAAAAMHGEFGAVAVAQAAAAPRIEPQPVIRVADAAPPSLRAGEIIAAPPPEPAQPAAAASRSYWPALIPQAHAETVHAPPPVAAQSRRLFVQAGAFAVPANAQRVRARIAALGSVEIVPTAGRSAELYQVRVGPVASEAAAARLLSKVVDSGFPGARVISE